MKVTGAQYDANAPVWIRVFHDGAVLGTSRSQKGGLWLTLDGDMIWHRVPIGEFLPTLGVYPRLKRVGITSGGEA
jgi:hypothetical protein